MTDKEIQVLAREIAARMDPLSLLDAEDVGALLKYQARYITEELQFAPGFPKAVRFRKEGKGRTHPRWIRSDITDYIIAMRDGKEKRPGRPRRPIDGG
jgi:hypothetical protein